MPAVTTTTASTTVVIAAPKRGPRESMFGEACPREPMVGEFTVMSCSQTQVRCLCAPPALRLNRAVQAVAGTARVHIAVVTRQKSTARRLVSSAYLAGLEV